MCIICSGKPISPSIQELSCYNCPTLTSFPENLPDDTDYSEYPWLPQNSKDYPDILPKLCQRYIRLRKFVKLTSSRAFNEYFYPENKGGMWAKKQLEKQFRK